MIQRVRPRYLTGKYVRSHHDPCPQACARFRVELVSTLPVNWLGDGSCQKSGTARLLPTTPDNLGGLSTYFVHKNCSK